MWSNIRKKGSGQACYGKLYVNLGLSCRRQIWGRLRSTLIAKLGVGKDLYILHNQRWRRDPCSHYHFITRADAVYAAGRKGRVPVHQDHVPAHLAVLRLALVAVSQESWRAGPSTQVSPKASLDPLRLAAVVKGPASPHCCLKRGRSLFCTRPPPTPGSKVSAPLSSTLQEIKIKKAGRQTIKAWVFRFLFSRTQ